ncbi:MAG: hypothetical protein MK134_04155 [Dehalococcoidia bacterium]|nr:hypothetical protein [Dehalococcoidia bacterium]
MKSAAVLTLPRRGWLTCKPVVTSNQTTFWWCMREMGITEAIPGGGTLMGRERHAEAVIL